MRLSVNVAVLVGGMAMLAGSPVFAQDIGGAINGLTAIPGQLVGGVGSGIGLDLDPFHILTPAPPPPAPAEEAAAPRTHHRHRLAHHAVKHRRLAAHHRTRHKSVAHKAVRKTAKRT